MRAAEFNHFDADVYRAAQEVPTLMFRGRLYRGRLLSIEEWMPFATRISAIERRQSEGPAVSPDELFGLYREYLRTVFPNRLRRFWWPDPVRLLMREPWGIIIETLTRFFCLQELAMRPRERPQ